MGRRAALTDQPRYLVVAIFVFEIGKNRKRQLIELHLPSRQRLLTLDPSFFFLRIILDVEAISVFGGGSFLCPGFERKILTFIQLLNFLVNVRQAHAEKFFARIYFVHLQC